MIRTQFEQDLKLETSEVLTRVDNGKCGSWRLDIKDGWCFCHGREEGCLNFEEGESCLFIENDKCVRSHNKLKAQLLKNVVENT